MGDQALIQSSVDISLPDCDETAVSPLLRVPREIRNQIYSYFVTVDQIFDGEREGNYDGQGDVASVISRLRFNCQIWAEVWDYMVKSNIWIDVNIGANSTLHGYFFYRAHWYPYLRFPLYRAPAAVTKCLDDEVAIRMVMEENAERSLEGDQNHRTYLGIGKRDSYIVAYHPLTYGALINALRNPSNNYRCLTTQLHPLPLLDKSRFTKLLTPLRTVRGLSVCPGPPSPGLMIGLCCDHFEVMCQYWLGITNTVVPSKYYREGTPEYNSLCDLNTDICIGFACSASRHVSQLAKRVGLSEVDKSHISLIVHLGQATSRDVLERFVGLSDRQRREAHLYR